MYGPDRLIDGKYHADAFNLPPFTIVQMIAQSPAFIRPVRGFQTGLFPKIEDELLGIGKIGRVYKYG